MSQNYCPSQTRKQNNFSTALNERRKGRQSSMINDNREYNILSSPSPEPKPSNNSKHRRGSSGGSATASSSASTDNKSKTQQRRGSSGSGSTTSSVAPSNKPTSFNTFFGGSSSSKAAKKKSDDMATDGPVSRGGVASSRMTAPPVQKPRSGSSNGKKKNVPAGQSGNKLMRRFGGHEKLVLMYAQMYAILCNIIDWIYSFLRSLDKFVPFFSMFIGKPFLSYENTIGKDWENFCVVILRPGGPDVMQYKEL